MRTVSKSGIVNCPGDLQVPVNEVVYGAGNPAFVSPVCIAFL